MDPAQALGIKSMATGRERSLSDESSTNAVEEQQER
jgi:hypothetical protein